MKMDGKMMTETEMMQRCQGMEEQKKKLAADLKTQDAELTAQIAEMNRAAEDKKLDLMAGIVTQMVAQRTDLNARRSEMEEGMMQHMMEHMQIGKKSMSQCPMMKDMKDMKDMKGMKGMKGMKEKSDDAHKAHHTEKK